LSRNTNLSNPIEVEKHVYGLSISSNYKNKLLDAYQILCNYNKIQYHKPKKLKVIAYVVHIPLESNIDKVIASCAR
jgi:hypothetical protein